MTGVIAGPTAVLKSSRLGSSVSGRHAQLSAHDLVKLTIVKAPPFGLPTARLKNRTRAFNRGLDERGAGQDETCQRRRRRQRTLNPENRV